MVKEGAASVSGNRPGRSYGRPVGRPPRRRRYLRMPRARNPAIRMTSVLLYARGRRPGPEHPRSVDRPGDKPGFTRESGAGTSASPPGRIPVPHELLDALPPDAMDRTVVLAVAVAALLAAGGDGALLADEVVAEVAGGMDARTVAAHRERLRAVYFLEEGRPGVWRWYRRPWDPSAGVAYVAPGVLQVGGLKCADRATLVALASWSDYQGRRHPGARNRLLGARADGLDPGSVRRCPIWSTATSRRTVRTGFGLPTSSATRRLPIVRW